MDTKWMFPKKVVWRWEDEKVLVPSLFDGSSFL